MIKFYLDNGHTNVDTSAASNIQKEIIDIYDFTIAERPTFLRKRSPATSEISSGDCLSVKSLPGFNPVTGKRKRKSGGGRKIYNSEVENYVLDNLHDTYLLLQNRNFLCLIKIVSHPIRKSVVKLGREWI